MTDEERRLLDLRNKLPALRSRVENGMVVVEQLSDGKVTQFPSEAAARFYVDACSMIPVLIARIEELEKCSDPTLVDALVRDVAARKLEITKLHERIEQLEGERATEANEHAKTRARLNAANGVVRRLNDVAKRVAPLEAELAKARADLDSVLPGIRENLETISKQETLLQQTMETCRIAVSERDAAYQRVTDLERAAKPYTVKS